MPLPKVSEATRRKIEREWQSYEDPIGFIVDMGNKLEEDKNPSLSALLIRYTEAYMEEWWSEYAALYAFVVYRLLEEESGGRLHVVSESTIEPMRVDFMANHLQFVKTHWLRIYEENPEILEALATIFDLVMVEEHREDERDISMIGLPGLFVYRLLEIQLEADEMEKLLA